MAQAPAEATPPPTQPARAASRRNWRQTLFPLNHGPHEIPALDGLRAVAALGVLVYHAYYSVQANLVIGGLNTTFLWNYGQTGVHLFFILSGFLLFTPYAKAMLEGKPLPSLRRFYARRALRIIPAYVVCLAILVALSLPQYLSLTGLENIGLHLVFFHDDVPLFNRAIEGPMWTLAVEVQFYLLLPLFTAVAGRLVGATRSRERVFVCVLGFIGGALLLRAIDTEIHGRLITLHGATKTIATLVFWLTYGVQGKYLEVFGLGMLGSVLFVIGQSAQRQRKRKHQRKYQRKALANSTPGWPRAVGRALFVGAFPVSVALAAWANSVNIETPPYFLLYHATDLAILCGPLLVGLGYAMLVMGALWSDGRIRAIFEWAPLRFVGLISYSLYLWHQPIIFAARPLTTALPTPLQFPAALVVGLVVALPVAYLSYQFVERPFLQRRKQIGERAEEAFAAPASLSHSSS